MVWETHAEGCHLKSHATCGTVTFQASAMVYS